MQEALEEINKNNDGILRLNRLKNIGSIVQDAALTGIFVHPACSFVLSQMNNISYREACRDENTLKFAVGAMGISILYDVGKNIYKQIQNNKRIYEFNSENSA